MNSEPVRSAPPKGATTAMALVALMWFAYFLNYCDRQAVFAMFPSLKASLSMSDHQLGLVGAVFLWVYAIGCPISGYLGDRFSKRLLVVLSLVVWSLVTIGTGLVASGAALLAMRAAMGVSESLYMSSAVALTAGAYPAARRSRAVSMLMTGQIAGTVAGSWFGGWMADRGQWREAFFALGAVGVLYALPYFAFLRRVKEPQADKVATTAGITFSALTRSRTFLLLCLVFPVFVFGIWLLYGWLPAFLHGKFHLNQADAAFNATVFLQTATFVGVIGGGMIADALYHRTKAARFWLMVCGLMLSAPCIHALGNSDTLLVTRIAATGFGLFSGLFIANIFPATFDIISSTARATAVGMLNFFGAITSGFATLFGGMWKQTLGIDRMLSITALAYLVAGAALIIGIRTWFPRDLAQTQVSS
ncbi:MAG: MFS transporter [Prosthecobacter sp.]|uniref:MFS transporter n=1 Tax=Prosthecobacter sp. TaxID=1965333 RepID=UPI0025F8D16D|nr:MFS transporter [Prosthecobacter sp.]MCF7784848.1 MFS transporter [Prosthecobacter sp.]